MKEQTAEESVQERLQTGYGVEAVFVGGADYVFSGVGYYNGKTMVLVGETWEEAEQNTRSITQ